jgi:hypothetical protein
MNKIGKKYSKWLLESLLKAIAMHNLKMSYAEEMALLI